MAVELENTFTVPVPPEQAWDVLLDVGRIAPCMPGASVLAVNGDEADAGDSTLVSIHTLLNVTGRPAQFGRSLLPEVSGKLVAQFAANLEAMIIADNAGDEPDKSEAFAGGVEDAASGSATAAGEYVTVAASQPTVPVVKQEESPNAFKFVVIPVLKRVLPIAAVGAPLTVIIRRLARRKSS